MSSQRSLRRRLGPFEISTVFLCLALLAAGCSTEHRGSALATVFDSAGIVIREVTPTGPVVYRELSTEPTVVIGEDNGSPDYSLGRVGGGIFLTDGRIAVADGFATAIKVFSGQGDFLATWGGPGPGPGEFGMVWTLTRYRGDSVVVGESGARRLSVLDSDGVFGRIVRPQVAMPPDPSVYTRKSCCDFRGTLDSGEFLISYPEQIPVSGPEPRWGRLTLLATDADGESPRPLGAFPSGEYQSSGGRSHRPSIGYQINTEAVVVPHPAGFVQLDGSDHSVHFFSPEGVLQAIGRVNKPRLEMSQDIRETFVAGYQRQVARSGRPPEETLLSSSINQPYPDSLPAFNFALVDDLGNVWAGRNWPTRAPGLGGFEVFAPDGTYLGEVALPRKMWILDVSSTRVLALVKDALDVPFLHVYELNLP